MPIPTLLVSDFLGAPFNNFVYRITPSSPISGLVIKIRRLTIFIESYIDRDINLKSFLENFLCLYLWILNYDVGWLKHEIFYIDGGPIKATSLFSVRRTRFIYAVSYIPLYSLYLA